MIRADQLTKRYGATTALDNVTFIARPGIITGFLGPNGAGKSTAMRLILGLDHPSSGTATVNGRRYRELTAPMREVGAVLDANAIDRTRRAHQHLDWLARAGGIDRTRVDDVLELVGLAGVADRRIEEYSLGMTQRLALAAAMLGDPPTLVLDEPMNGLDPDGIHWLRRLLSEFAAEGRTVLLSSHLMSEVEASAGHVIVLARGAILADSPTAALTMLTGQTTVRVEPSARTRLRHLLVQAGAHVSIECDGALTVTGLDAAAVGQLTVDAHISLLELTPRRSSLESVFLELTHPDTEHRGCAPSPTTSPP